MSRLRIVGIAGNLTRPSRTRTLVGAVLAEAAARGLGATELFDLVDAGPELGATLSRDAAAERVDRVLSAIEGADVLVAASPVYKGSYTGLFKHLFDLLDPKALDGQHVLVAATGGSERHALVIEHQMRPLFAFFGATTLPISLYASNGDFGDPEGLAPPIRARIARAVEQLAALQPVRQARLARRKSDRHFQAQSRPERVRRRGRDRAGAADHVRHRLVEHGVAGASGDPVPQDVAVGIDGEADAHRAGDVRALRFARIALAPLEMADDRALPAVRRDGASAPRWRPALGARCATAWRGAATGALGAAGGAAAAVRVGGFSGAGLRCRVGHAAPRRGEARARPPAAGAEAWPRPRPLRSAARPLPP